MKESTRETNTVYELRLEHLCTGKPEHGVEKGGTHSSDRTSGKQLLEKENKLKSRSDWYLNQCALARSVLAHDAIDQSSLYDHLLRDACTDVVVLCSGLHVCQRGWSDVDCRRETGFVREEQPANSELLELQINGFGFPEQRGETETQVSERCCQLAEQDTDVDGEVMGG